MKWIKFITREITQEERDDFGGAADALIWDSPVPEEDEEVLVSDKDKEADFFKNI